MIIQQICQIMLVMVFQIIKKPSYCISDWRVTLLESINKRCVFLEHVVDVTGLTNVKIVRDRAEVQFVGLFFGDELLQYALVGSLV